MPDTEVQPRALEEIIDEIKVLQDDVKLRNKETQLLETQVKDLIEKELWPRMDEVGTTLAAGQLGIAQISEDEFPKIDDWDLFYDHIRTENAFHLLQRRPAVKALGELRKLGTPIPGTSVYEAKKLTVKAR